MLIQHYVSVYILFVHISTVHLALEATQKAESDPESVTGWDWEEPEPLVLIRVQTEEKRNRPATSTETTEI